MKTITLEEINFIRNAVFETVEFNRVVEIEFFETDGISVEYDGKKARIGADSRASLARGCFLLAMELDSGKESVSIQEKARFKSRGIMLECDWAIMKVETVKKYMNILVSLGLNTLMLYTEDTFEISNRPRFGYMRGRYGKDELRELVAYGEQIGMELIPCIETLGHLQSYLKWAALRGASNFDTGEDLAKIRNSDDTLLIDCDETYRFIEDAIRTCREVFHSDRIHLGMDESENAFKERFFEINGIQPHGEVFIRHLKRVVDICKKYDFKPMIWSDMVFHLNSAIDFYYDPDAVFTDEFKKSFPEVDFAYWDYRQVETDTFDKMMKKHAELERQTGFFNAFQTWISPLVSFQSSVLAGHAGMKACLKNNIDLVMTTVWGGCNCMQANTLLPLISEYCFKGENCTEEDVRRASEYLTKIPYETAAEMGDANCIVDPEKAWRLQARRLLWGDILYDMSCDLKYCDAIIETYSAHAEHLKKQMATVDKNYDLYLYAYLVYKVGIQKAKLRQNLQKAYLENDREYLRSVAEDILPNLANDMEVMEKCHKRQWEATYKMFGYETERFCYAGAIGRIREIAERISRYLAGEIPCIEELQAERIPNGLGYCNIADVVTPRMHLGKLC